MKTYVTAGAFLALALAGGCQTFLYDRQEEEMRELAEQQRLRVQLTRLEDRCRSLEEANESIFREIQELRNRQGGLTADAGARMQALEQAIQALQQAQEPTRKAIVDEISGKLQTLLKNQPAPQARFEEGYEHVVKTGETLSEIATAYGVTPRKIMEANKLRNENVLQVGQKLFIPR